MQDLYQELIIDHGTNPRNFSILENSNYQADAYNPLCGDQIKLFLIVNNQTITQATFQGHGCAISTASASIMTELLINTPITMALKLYQTFIKTLTNNNCNYTDDYNSKEKTDLSLTNFNQNPFSYYSNAQLNVLDSCVNHSDNQLPEKLLALLGVKKYPARVKCATLAWHTLDAALNSKVMNQDKIIF